MYIFCLFFSSFVAVATIEVKCTLTHLVCGFIENAISSTLGLYRVKEEEREWIETFNSFRAFHSHLTNTRKMDSIRWINKNDFIDVLNENRHTYYVCCYFSRCNYAFHNMCSFFFACDIIVECLMQ